MPSVSDAPPADSKRARHHAAAALTVIVLTVGSVAIKRARARLAPRPTAEQCSALVDRFVEQSLRQRDEAKTTEELASAVDRARTAPEHHADAVDCERRLSREQVECALAAGNVDQLERCLQ